MKMAPFRQIVRWLTGHCESFGRPCKAGNTRDLRKHTRMFSNTPRLYQKFGQTSSKSRQHSVGVIGAGRIASSVHIPNILNNHRLQLRWIVENNPEAIKPLQDKLYLDIPFYTSDHTKSLLDDPSLSAVFIFTPTPTHYDIILSSLHKGKAVFTEKPTAEKLTEISTLYDTAARLELPLLTGYMRRFDAAFQDIYDMLVQGQLGKLHICKVTSRDSPKPSYELLRTMDRTGCNILSDMAVHDFDFMSWIMQGTAPESIYVVTHAHDPIMAEIGQPDVSSVIMKYPDGSVAILDSSRESCYGYDNRVELFGSHGMATLENPRQSFATKNFDIGALQKPLMHSFPQRYREAYQNEIDHFVDCMEGKASPRVTKEDCVLTGLMVEAAVESYKQNQAINFPEFLSNRATLISRHQVA
ncbi:myo-inositol 2-dehydrogenase-like isoform X3 [Liolophura sinensis]